MTRRAVLLFTQPAPREARVKRLAGAEPLFDRLRGRTIAAALAVPGVDLVVVGDPGPLRLPVGARVLPQRGGSFGERLENAFEDVRSLGLEEVVAVGADSPGLDARHLAEAFAALRSHQVVLGPAPDGGVYLIGLRGDAEPLLRGVRWRTSAVLSQLRERSGDAVVLAAVLSDVDGRSDLGAFLDDPALDPELAGLIVRLLNGPAVPLPLRFGRILRPLVRAADPRGPPALSRLAF